MVEKLVKDMTGIYTYIFQTRFITFTCLNSVQIIDTWQQYLCVVPSKRKTYEGDSGGPMICNGWQYGVCSFSINLKDEEMQTIHVFVDYYRKWVNDIIEPEQSTRTSITTKRKRMKNYKINQKSTAKLMLPYHVLYTILGILWYNVYYVLSFNFNFNFFVFNFLRIYYLNDPKVFINMFKNCIYFTY